MHVVWFLLQSVPLIPFWCWPILPPSRPGAAPEGKGAHVLGLRADEEGRQLCGSAALAQVDEPRAQHGAVLQRHVGAGIDVGGPAPSEGVVLVD